MMWSERASREIERLECICDRYQQKEQALTEENDRLRGELIEVLRLWMIAPAGDNELEALLDRLAYKYIPDVTPAPNAPIANTAMSTRGGRGTHTADGLAAPGVPPPDNGVGGDGKAGGDQKRDGAILELLDRIDEEDDA